jgi:hypothetical protein
VSFDVSGSTDTFVKRDTRAHPDFFEAEAT